MFLNCKNLFYSMYFTFLPLFPLQYRGGDPKDISLWARRSKWGLTWHSGRLWIQMLAALVGHTSSPTSVDLTFDIIINVLCWLYYICSNVGCSYSPHFQHQILVQTCDITIHVPWIFTQVDGDLKTREAEQQKVSKKSSLPHPLSPSVLLPFKKV